MPAKPVELFTGNYATAVASRSYDVTRDGRFLLRRPVLGSVDERFKRIHPSTLRVILHWSDEFRRNLGK